jgi:N-acetylglucosamine-6-phosphate deacetylase
VSGTDALWIHGGRVLTPEGWLDEADVLIEAGVISAVGAGLRAPSARRFDAKGLMVAPGFIDVHVHGAAGAMCEEGTPEALRRISATLARFGVTGFLATIATLPAEAMRKAVSAVAEVADDVPGARILGIHLEGPCLSPLRAGAQAVPFMRAMSPAELDDLQRASGGRVRLVTLAPEVDGAMALLEHAVAAGIRVAVGHSNATETEMLAALAAGATHVTHLFNAMRELHHREPGPIGVGLTEDAVSVELICDGHHLAPRIVDLAFRCKPRGKAVLVSDAVAALGLPEGDCELFGVACRIEGGAVRLRQGGQLAGSCLRLDAAVRNLRAWLPGIALDEALTAATAAPAAVAGASACGRVSPGCIADLVVLDPGLEVVATICRGCPIWER